MSMALRLRLLLPLLLGAIGSGCVGMRSAMMADRSAPAPREEAGAAQAAAVARPPSVPAPASGPADPSGQAVALHAPAAESDDVPARRIVYEARLKIVVAAIDAAEAAARRFTEDAGGYLQEQSRGSVVLRIPAAQFRPALERIEALGIVSDRQVRAEDVTESYVDLEARLRNARAVETRLKSLLASAKDVKEALEVEKELHRVGEEIEQLEGKLKLLTHRVAYSLIAVEFQTKATVPAEIDPLVRLPFRWIREAELASLMDLATNRNSWR